MRKRAHRVKSQPSDENEEKGTKDCKNLCVKANEDSKRNRKRTIWWIIDQNKYKYDIFSSFIQLKLTIYGCNLHRYEESSCCKYLTQ